MKYLVLIVMLALIAVGIGRCRATRLKERVPPVSPARPSPAGVGTRAPGSEAGPGNAPPPLPRGDAGDNAIQAGRLELYPTCSAVGIELPYSGDANSNAAAAFVWRRRGETRWRRGIEMTVDRERKRIWAGIWPLAQGVPVEVKITLADPDPIDPPLTDATATRRLVLTNRQGRVFFVSGVKGSDRNPGTGAAPFKTLGRAVEGVKAGDTVYVRSGVYHESLSLGLSHRGEPGRPIVIAAAPGEQPVMDGSVEVPRGSAGWTRVAHAVFGAKADFGDAGAGYVAMNGRRMYRYGSLDALLKDESETGRAFFYDRSRKLLYVGLGGYDAPTSHLFAYATQPCAFSLEGASNVVIRGFEVRGYGTAGISVSGTSAGNIVRENRIHNVPRGVFVGTAATRDNAIWNNEVFENGLDDFSPAAIERSNYPREGILAEKAGRGTSICDNKVYGFVNGIGVESRENPDRLDFNRDVDIMFNTIYNVADVAVDLGGGGVNVRCHANAMRNAGTAVGIAPIERGPVYVTRNQASYRVLMFNGNASLPSEGWTYCFNNSGYTILAGNESTMIRFNDYGLPDRRRAFRNNAIIGSGWSVQSGRSADHAFDYNGYFNTPATGFRKFQWDKEVYISFTNFQARTGQESHGIYADPKFSSTPDLAQYPAARVPALREPSAGDLRLQPGSPLIDKGAVIPGVTDGFKGKAPDMGAYETGG